MLKKRFLYFPKLKLLTIYNVNVSTTLHLKTKYINLYNHSRCNMLSQRNRHINVTYMITLLRCLNPTKFRYHRKHPIVRQGISIELTLSPLDQHASKYLSRKKTKKNTSQTFYVFEYSTLLAIISLG